MLKPTFPLARLAGAAALMLATAPAALADLQAQTIWADWQDVYNRFGGTLGADTESYANGTLTLDGVNYRTEIAGAVSAANYGTITMVEQADGTVVIEIPAEMRADTTSTMEGAEIGQTMTLRHENLSIVAREDAGLRVYDMSADTMTFDIETVVAADGDETGPTMVTVRLAGMESEYRSGLGDDGQRFAQTFALDGVDIGSRFINPEGPVDVSYALTGVESTFEGSYGEVPAGPVGGLSDLNITYDGTMTHSGSILSVAGLTPDGPLNIAGTSQAGTIALDLTEELLGYSLTSTDGQITAQVPGFPLPVNVSMAEIGSAFALPIGETGTEKPFALKTTLRDLVVDDVLWSMVDPTGQLPRDPATLVLDLDGTAVMTVDMFGDPEAAAQMTGAPGALKSLTLNQLLLTVAGAELRGSGMWSSPRRR